MTHPTEEEVVQLVTDYREIQAPVRELAIKLMKAEYRLTGLLREHKYTVKLGVQLTGNEWVYAFAIHPEYLEDFNKGLYNTDKRAWDSSMGEVPSWSVIAFYMHHEQQYRHALTALMDIHRWLQDMAATSNHQ